MVRTWDLSDPSKPSESASACSGLTGGPMAPPHLLSLEECIERVLQPPRPAPMSWAALTTLIDSQIRPADLSQLHATLRDAERMATLFCESQQGDASTQDEGRRAACWLVAANKFRTNLRMLTRNATEAHHTSPSAESSWWRRELQNIWQMWLGNM